MIRIGIHSGNSDIKIYLKILSKINGFVFNGLFIPGVQSTLPNKFRSNNNFEEFLKQNDAILFVNYQKPYYENLLKAIKFSKHILFYDISKIDFEQAQELKKITEEANIVFKIGINNSFLTSIKNEQSSFENPALLETIIEKKIIKNQIIDTIISNNLVEYIYQILLLIKGNVKRVVAKSVSIYNEHNDVANINLEFDNGTIATICINTISKKEAYNITFYSHQFKSSIDLINNKILTDSSKSHIKSRKKLVKNVSSRIIELTEFLEIINKKPAISPSLAYGIKALEVIARIQDKLRITSNGIE
ncbi:MAG: hypothetical protein GXO79_01550 [Chlorobi bacterium]|nr:hypothetical protein [Chlorobiota bacterium]